MNAISKQIREAALGPAPWPGGRYSCDWLGSGTDATYALGRFKNDNNEDFMGFMRADTDTRRLFLLLVAEAMDE